jgi:hypothetical protein
MGLKAYYPSRFCFKAHYEAYGFGWATTAERRMRTFIVELKRKIVREIEQKKITIAQVARQYSLD